MKRLIPIISIMAGPGGAENGPDGSAVAGDEPVVLLVEDQESVREAMRLWIESDGEWETKVASDGREALDRLDGRVDILVLDRRMPKLTGDEVLEECARFPDEVPVIVVSAVAPNGELDEYISEYLTKPVEREVFLDALCRHV